MFEMGLDQDWVRVEGLMRELSGLQTEINRLQARQVEIVAELDPVLLRDLIGSRTIRDWLTAQLDVTSPTALKLRQTDPNHSGFGRLFRTGEIGLDRAYLLTKLDQTGLTPTELDTRATDYSLGRLYVEWERRRRVDQESSQERFDDRYLVIQPSLDSSAHRFWGQAVGTDSEAILRAISQRETELPVLEDETTGHRQLDALASICLDSLTGRETGRDVTVAEVVIDGLLAAATNAEAGVTLGSGPKVGPEVLEEIFCHGQVRVNIVGEHSISYSDLGETVPRPTRLYILERDQRRCGIDGCHSQYRLQIHHITPRSHGGNHHPDNLITLCWYHHHIAIHGRGMELDPNTSRHRKRLRWPGTEINAPPGGSHNEAYEAVE